MHFTWCQSLLVYIGDVNMGIMSHGIIDMKGSQHSKHVRISLFQTELFLN